jgi:HK97 family phage major capsid protein
MTTPPIAPLDFSGIIPIEYSTQIIEEAIQKSAVLQLANLVPMGTEISEMPVPTSLPSAGWVSVAGGRKPYTSLGLGMKTLHAEEVAAVTAIPDVYLEDASINLWAWVRPRLAEAIAIALDEAVLFGHNNPATFPGGGVIDVDTCTTVAPGYDAADTVNLAMSAVEAQGLEVDGDCADVTVRGMLRGLRDSMGALLLGYDQINGKDTQTLWGIPIAYTPFVTGAVNFITGDWDSLVIGVRQDIRYAMDPSAVIADDTGKVIISGFQDNTTPLKVWARFGCTIINPVTRLAPNGALPFAATKLANWVPPAGAVAAEGSTPQRSVRPDRSQPDKSGTGPADKPGPKSA